MVMTTTFDGMLPLIFAFLIVRTTATGNQIDEENLVQAIATGNQIDEENIGRSTGTVHQIDAVQFLLSKDKIINKLEPLPPAINFNCELIVEIEIKPVIPTKQDYDYEDSIEENSIEPVAEKGEAVITLKHPNFQDGAEEIVVSFNETGYGRKRETICFKFCENITQNKAYTLNARMDVDGMVDVKLVTKIGNPKCQLPPSPDIVKILLGCTTIFFVTTTIITCLLLYREKNKNHQQHSVTNENATAPGANASADTLEHEECEAFMPKSLTETEGTEEAGINVMRQSQQVGTPEDSVVEEDTHKESLELKEGGEPTTPKEIHSLAPGEIKENRKMEEIEICTTLGGQSEKSVGLFFKSCDKHKLLLIASVVSSLFAFVFAILTALL